MLIYLGTDAAEATLKHVPGETVYVVDERLGDAQRFAGLEAAQEYRRRANRDG